MDRRRFLHALGAGLCATALPRLALAAADGRYARIGAAWRGPRPTDPYFAGVLEADWEARKLSIRYALPLPTRPHGLIPEADGGLTLAGVRPGAWLLRCDGDGRVVRRRDIAQEGECRLGGHLVRSPDGAQLLTTETDYRNGRGRIGVRDADSFAKIDEWDSHGRDPHQLIFDATGRLLVANGGVPRTLEDKKYDLDRMDSSLVRLDGRNGALHGQWRLDDRRLSLRHLAVSRPAGGVQRVGIALQAEHNDPVERARAPILAVFDGERLETPTRANDGIGYSGDIAPAHRGGFVLSSNQAGLAQLWHPAAPEKLLPVVQIQEAYALAPWPGPEERGGVLVATALGLVRYHPTARPLILPWPEPMALDNHWVSFGEA